MSVLIKGMEMPKKKNGAVLIIYPDGRCAFENGKEYKVVPVPPHGRLIDADMLLASFKESIDECHKWANEIPNETEMYARVSQSLGTFVECSLRTKGMPTVIEAESSSERELQRDYEVSVEYAQHCGRYEPTYDPDTGAM